MQKIVLSKTQNLIHMREPRKGNRKVSLNVSLADTSLMSFSIRSGAKTIPV